MSGIAVHVSMDASQLVAAMEKAARETGNAIRRSVYGAAVATRKKMIAKMAEDMNIEAGYFEGSISKPTRPSAGNYTSTTYVKRKAVNAMRVGEFHADLSWNRGSYDGRSYLLTTGGWTAVHVPKGFLLGRKNLLAIRHGTGRKAFKVAYGANTTALLSQGDGAPRREWLEEGQRELDERLTVTLAAALSGGAVPAG